MARAPRTDARTDLATWVERAMRDDAADRRRKARLLRSWVDRLKETPPPSSLKGVGADDLRAWADQLESEAV